MAFYNKIIENVKEEEKNPGSHADKVKSLLIGGVKNVGAFYDAGDKATGIYEPMEAISDQISEIPVVGRAGSFAWDVFRPDFLDAAAMKTGPAAGAGQYVASLPAGVARATGKRLKNNPKLIENSIDAVLNAPRKLSEWGKRKVADAQYLFGGGVGAGTGVGGGGIFRGFGQNFVPPNPSEVSKVTRKLLNENVLVGPDRLFDYGAFRALFTGDKRGRLLEQWMQTTPLVDVFESIYGDVMQLKGISRSKIQVDHLVTLRSSMPIYDGVAFGSPLWNKIQETLLRSKNRYNPGNTLDNLDALDPGSHIVKSNFFNNRIGKDGELFFTPDRLAYMRESDANRIEVLKDFIKIQDEGTLILREAKSVWEALYKIDGAEMPLDIINRLSEIPLSEFSHPELRNLDQLRAIITDIVESGAKKGRPKKIQNTLKRLYPDVNPDTGDIQGNLFDQ